MPRYPTLFSKQKGIAALIVTLLITLIATVATIYASRNSLLTQKTSSNGYQYVASTQAAEAGANDFINIINNDLAKLATDSSDTSTQLIETNPPVTGTANCFSNLQNGGQYRFKSKYRDATNSAQFDSTNYFSRTIDEVTAISSVTQGLAYRVQSKLADGAVYISSEGCTENTRTYSATNPANTPYCTNNQPLAKISKKVKLPITINTGNNAFVNKGYVDIFGAIHVAKENPAISDFTCSMVTGGSSTHTGAKGYELSSVPELNALSPDNFFQLIFNQNKNSMKSNSGVQVVSPATPPAATSCPTINSGTDILWIDGPTKFNTPCTFNSGRPLVVIVNGDLTFDPPDSTNGKIEVNGFLYANNVNRKGQILVRGAAAFAGDMDGLVPNIATDGNATNSAFGNTTVYYNPDRFKLPSSSSSSSITGSWIDF